MQFGFMPGRGTKDVIVMISQLQEKYLGRGRNRILLLLISKRHLIVSREVVCWGMRQLGVDELLVLVIQSMYVNTRSLVRFNNNSSDEFNITVVVHQGSVLSLLLFTIVLEALSQECRTSCHFEML